MPDDTSPTPNPTAHDQTALPHASAAPSRRPTSSKQLAAAIDAPVKKKSISYADAGVDISSGDRSKQRIKMLARKTFNKQVLSEIGGFGGLFALDLEKFPNPVLVFCALVPSFVSATISSRRARSSIG